MLRPEGPSVWPEIGSVSLGNGFNLIMVFFSRNAFSSRIYILPPLRFADHCEI